MLLTIKVTFCFLFFLKFDAKIFKAMATSTFQNPKNYIIYLLALIIVFAFYHRVLLHPNQYMFSNSGDGMKNYYTYAYHIKNDASYVNFSGMNYPYGENYLYTDCHPVLANALMVLGNIFPSTKLYSIGIVNFLMIISIFFTLIILYHILRLFSVPIWFSFFSALGITALAPQLFRLTGHLALSYSVCIPLTLYLIIRYGRSDKKHKWTIFLMLNNLFWLFIHAYLGMMAIAFHFAYWLISSFYKKEKLYKCLQHYVYLLISIVIPVIFFVVYVSLTDIHLGRTDNPSGFLNDNAEPDDIFMPHHPPLRPVYDKIFPFEIKIKWESWSYVGISTTAVLITLLSMFIRKLVKKQENSFLKAAANHELTIAVLAGTIVLLYAFGIPFKQIPSLLDAFPVFKQFRSTGRFTWVFFFVITLFCSYTAWNWSVLLRNKNQKVASILLMIAVPLSFFCEGSPYHKEYKPQLTQASNVFVPELMPSKWKEAIDGINSSDYQAIFPLPFYYAGSESFSRPRNNDIVKESMTLSYHMNLPIMGAYLTRTSIPESKKIVQVVSPGFYEKPIRQDIKSDKPFLVIVSREPLTDYENDILKRCKLVLQNNDFSLYSLQVNDLFYNPANDEYQHFLAIKNKLYQKQGFFVTDTSSFLYYNGYENTVNELTFREKGAYIGIKKGKNIFAEFAPNTFKKDKEYTVSLWMYNGYKDALNLWFRFIVEEYNPVANQWTSTVGFPESSEVINGDWSLFEMKFRVNDPKDNIYITSKGKDDAKGPLCADELLIRETGTDVYRVEQESPNIILFKNNHQIKLK